MPVDAGQHSNDSTYPDAQYDTFEYDAASRLLAATSGVYDNLVTMSYDAASRLISESLTIAASAPLSASHATYPVSHTYDLANRRTLTTYPDGSTVSRGYISTPVIGHRSADELVLTISHPRREW